MSGSSSAPVMASSPIRRWGGWILLTAVLLVVGVGAINYATDSVSVPLGDAGQSLWYVVRPGPLTISLSANGAIKSKDQIVIRNELPGKTTIVKLVPEGTAAKKGDLLVELDSSQIRKDLVNQQIQLNKSDADLIKSGENLAVVKNTAESEQVKAEVELNDAQINHIKYQEGEFNRDLYKAKAALDLARATAEQSKEKLKWSQALFSEGYISSNELETDRLTKEKHESDLKTAEMDLDLLEKYTKNQKLQELKGKVRQAELGLEKAKRKGAADIVQAEAEVRARQIENEREKTKLQTLQSQLDKSRIHAPTDGIVIYNTQQWRPDMRIAEGSEVFERQEMMYLPTSSSLIANVQVPEISVSKLKAGMSARVHVEAMPGKTLAGTVQNVGQFPDREQDWLNRDLKVYSIEIAVAGQNPDLRPGMSCQAEIMIQELDKALFVPVQSVVRVGAQPVVYVKGKEGVRRVSVKLGQDNNRMVHILEGVGEGDQVMLSPPLEDGAVDPARRDVGP